MRKQCPKCNADNREQARICSACGSPLAPSDSGVRYCPSGRHPMDPGWERCPYCASEDTAGEETTEGHASVQNAPDSTLPESSPPDRPSPPARRSSRGDTQIEPGGRRPQPSEPSAAGNRKKTAYGSASPQGPGGGRPFKPGTRRAVAVLVTYTWKAEGQLFPVREGRNFLGSDPECEISLGPELDPQTSAKHATIIYRGKDFWIDDEKSMNGTYVDGESVEEKQRLADGARIQTGATVWKFVSLEPPP